MIDLTRCHRPLMNCISEAAAALVGAGVSAAGSAASITMGGKMNQRAQHEAWRTREWQTKEREASQAWQLEQWNRQNAYNSPAEQLKRAKEAGINPLAVINGEFRPSEAGMPSGAQAPGGAQATFHNPMEGANVDGAMSSVLQFKQLELAKKKTDAEIKRMDYQNDKDRADTMTADLMRDGQAELLGANIKLTLANEKLSTQEVQNKIQDVLESQARTEQALKQIEYLGSEIDFKQLQKDIMSQKWPMEKKQMALDYLLTQAKRWGIREDNIGKHYDNEKSRHELEEYYENGNVNRHTYYGRSLSYRDEWQNMDLQQMEGRTKHPRMYDVDKVVDTFEGIASVVTSFANASSAIAKRGVSLRSNPNPSPQRFSISGQQNRSPFW